MRLWCFQTGDLLSCFGGHSHKILWVHRPWHLCDSGTILPKGAFSM
jgi:hypothetical protein